MSHLPTVQIPVSAPSAPAAPPHSTIASASVSASASLRSGPQPSICVPRHVAIVPEICGQTRAAALSWLDTLSAVIDGCAGEGIEQLSVLVCDENVAASEPLLREVRAWLCGHAAALARQGIVCTVIGEPDLATREALRFADRAGRENLTTVRLRVNLAIGYDGRSELAAAARTLVANGATALTPEALQQQLPSAALPPVDLLLRTGGETRLSHFLLWQTAYAELLFVKTPWAQFAREPLQHAFADFAQRRRTFGGLARK